MNCSGRTFYLYYVQHIIKIKSQLILSNNFFPPQNLDNFLINICVLACLLQGVPQFVICVSV